MNIHRENGLIYFFVVCFINKIYMKFMYLIIDVFI